MSWGNEGLLSERLGWTPELEARLRLGEKLECPACGMAVGWTRADYSELDNPPCYMMFMTDGHWLLHGGGKYCRGGLLRREIS